MSAEFASLKIRVNSIAPGYVSSEMTAKESDDKNKSELPDKKVQEKGHVPSGRAGGDRELASAAIFLATNHYTHGQVITVDGGVTDTVAS
jgi:NAD(P)-dependent dehydrogenase (short-subunit alcohol dehydrogenase family)